MNFLKKISTFLAKNTTTLIVLIAIIAFFFPYLFAWVRGNIQIVVLAVIMFSMGVTITTADFRLLAKRPFDICIGAVAQFTIMPFVAYFIAELFNLPTDIALGIILVGCCPGGMSSNIMTFLCRGDVPYSVGMSTVSTLLAPLMTPFLVLMLAGQRVAIPTMGMFITIMEAVLVPVLLGFFLNYKFSKSDTFEQLQGIMPGIAVIGFALIIGGVVSVQGARFFTSSLVIFVVVAAHNAIGFVLGYAVGKGFKFSLAKKRTLSIEVGMQNAGLGTSLAMAHFAAIPQAAVVTAVACVWQSIAGTALSTLFRKYDDRKMTKTISVGKKQQVSVQ
ncbi:bile acid:sodium symporter family protein [Pectinatus sottacetonis]|uniref:bile acid:sodium symporter family protein n=1 Tax=Pectinatus sottacetonis TaxID=1002795 RepID=UPI0018C84E71|nr:bile acid:sodium symporter family protein [Pectinatus sottacetonis]